MADEMADRDMWTVSGLRPSEDADIRQIQEFLWELRETLKEVVKNPRPAIPGRHHERLEAAWKPVAFPEKPTAGGNGHGFSWLVMNLDGTGKPGERETVHQKLSDVGLTGAPLAFKLGIYRHARDDYRDHGTVAQMQSEPKSRWPRMRRLLDRVLKTGSVILGSTPGGEYVKEIVEGVQSLIEISGDSEELSSTK